MKLFYGAEANEAFQRNIRQLKQSHLFWCGMTIQWMSNEIAPWIKDKNLLLNLEQQISKALDHEHEKAELLILKTGDMLFLAESPTNAAYKRVQIAVEAAIKGFDQPTEATKISLFDLSIDWDSFLQVSRDIYTKTNQLMTKSREEEKAILLDKLEEELKRHASSFEARQSKSRSLNLLFVEDEPSIRQLLHTILSNTPHSLSFAANGREAIEAYCRKPPHIVFLDINLPDISGHEILEMISRYDSSAYAVMLTAHTAQNDVQTAKQFGVKSYIVKPFSRQKLNDSIDRYFAS